MSFQSVAPILRLQRPEGFQSVAHAAMATDFSFWLGGHEPEYLRSAAFEAFATIDAIEDRLSLYREASDVARINLARPGELVRVSDETLQCLHIAREAAGVTGGAFNPFLGHLALRRKHPAADLPLHVLAALERVCPGEGPAVIQLEPGTNCVRKTSTAGLLDLGALGKGFALDRAAETLRDWDVHQACLIAGGSSILLLDPPNGTMGFDCELPDPKGGVGPASRLPPLAHMGLGASGLGFNGDHIIDPYQLGSATKRTQALAVAGDGAWADALSTAAMLLNEQQLEMISTTVPGCRFLIPPDARDEHLGDWRFIGQWS